MKACDLTPDERWLYAPLYEKILIRSFIVLLPFIGSIESINF
mgnify:CR=1 FL=1|jgi:hypothetical protein